VAVPGRLFFAAQGGLELLISSFPSAPVTLDSLSLSAGATRTTTRTVAEKVTKTVTVGHGKHRHKGKVKQTVKKKVKAVDSLLTNPSTCAGAWTGRVTLDYASGSDSLPFTASCEGPA